MKILYLVHVGHRAAVSLTMRGCLMASDDHCLTAMEHSVYVDELERYHHLTADSAHDYV